MEYRLQVGVKVILQRDDGKYLFMRRSEPLPDGSGIRWDIPGGRIKPEEPLMDALQREVSEEQGWMLRASQDCLLPKIFSRLLAFMSFA